MARIKFRYTLLAEKAEGFCRGAKKSQPWHNSHSSEACLGNPPFDRVDSIGQPYKKDILHEVYISCSEWLNIVIGILPMVIFHCMVKLKLIYKCGNLLSLYSTTKPSSENKEKS